MLDLKFIRENPDLVRMAAIEKKINLNLEELLQLDAKVLGLKRQLQLLEQERNTNAKQASKLSNDNRSLLIENGRRVAAEVQQLTPILLDFEKKLEKFLWLVPQIPSPDAPRGDDEGFNQEVKKFGIVKESELTPLDHIKILTDHNWVEFERITKIAGSRSYSIKNEMVQLEFALLSYALDLLKSKGFTLLDVPSYARELAFYGTGHFPSGKDQSYYLQDDDLYLAGTAEVLVNSLYSGEVLKESDLPILLGAFSPCFRREAGAAGKDTRGLMRVHQFLKVEQYILCRNDPEESLHWHQQLLSTSEEIIQSLQLPYRVMDVCTGDMGPGKVRQYDIEVWVPSEKKYRETHSCSMLYDWQARRSSLRYRDKNEKMHYCHTLNNTAIATPRILVPFLENHQQRDGSIFIPEVLRSYLGGRLKFN